MHLEIISAYSSKSAILLRPSGIVIPPFCFTFKTFTKTVNTYPNNSDFRISNSLKISSNFLLFSFSILSSCIIIHLSKRSAFVAPKLIPLKPIHRLKLYITSSSSVYSCLLENPLPSNTFFTH